MTHEHISLKYAGLDDLYPEDGEPDSLWTGQPLRMHVASRETPEPGSQA